MKNDILTKARHYIDAGDPGDLTTEQLTDALLSFAKRNPIGSESPEQSLARLVKESDPAVTTLSIAIDRLRRTSDPCTTITKRRLFDSASAMLDDHVEKSRQPGEGIPQTTARLATSGDQTFSELYSHLDQIKREL